MSAATTKSTVRNKHSNSFHNIDITKEEFSRISDALKKEEFRKLFLDYCEEIQDPANRQLYEDEIKQFEAERGVDVRFVKPEPGFVIKTSVDGEHKCFINVAKCEEVAKPSSEAGVDDKTGSRGLTWSIPMAQAGPRDDVDGHGKHCRVFDVIFHPDALYLANKNSGFRKCLVDTALDAVEREYQVNLDRANIKFPKMQFKGIAHSTVIRRLAKNASAEDMEPHPLESIYPAKPTAESTKPKIISVKTKEAEQPKFSTPKYTIKHRRDVDLTEFTNELDAKLNVTVPRELVVEIELPLLHSTAECQLDVTEKSLYLLSEKPGAHYRLKLDLPYSVRDKEGSARFEADKRRLCITLPVVQLSVEKQRNMHEMLIHLNREDSGVESDVREELNGGESPIQEVLSDAVENNAENDAPKSEEENTAVAKIVSTPVTTPATFLKSSIHYFFPAKFDCNVLDNVISLVLHVRNVQNESIATINTEKSIHVQFTSIGSGYYPTYYAFYLELPSESNFKIESFNTEAWENNVVLNLNLAATSENLKCYLAGLDSNDLKEYPVQGKFQVLHGSRQRKKSPQVPPQAVLSSSLDISVERSDGEKSIEIEIKPKGEELASSACTANTNTTDDEETHQRKKTNKKHKKKNKKRRSLSESACDDIKAFQKNQLEFEKQKNAINECKEVSAKCVDTAPIAEKDEKNAMKPEKLSASVAVPTGGAPQRIKQRSFSECRDSVSSSVGGQTSFKGILKHFSRYDPRPSISDSSSSIDDCCSYSCSAEAGVASSLGFSQSFSDIPEENVNVELSESCKKTVRFNEVIKEQIFRLNSSILGQRKKNQKRRNQKQRALQRRHSEGDSADYEEIKPALSDSNSTQYFKQKCHNNNKINICTNNNCKIPQHDSGLDLSNSKESVAEKKKPSSKKSSDKRSRMESESSSDVDHNKNSMMFEMDM